MEVEVSSGISPWDGVVELTKAAQEKDSDPVVWGIQIYSNLNAVGESLPSVELTNVLVSYICRDNNVPILWKFLDNALMLKIVSPILLLALLSVRVFPSRHFQPAAYRLFMQLLKTHAFQLKSQINGPNYQKIMKPIDAVFHLSHIFGMSRSEPGILVVEFIFSIVWQLLDASLDDEGLLELTPEKKSRWATLYQEIELERHDNYDNKKTEYHEQLQNANTLMAVEIIGQFLQDKISSRILYLARQNFEIMQLYVFLQSLQWCFHVSFFELMLLAENSSALRNSKTLSPEALLKLTSDTHMVLSRECKSSMQSWLLNIFFCITLPWC